MTVLLSAFFFALGTLFASFAGLLAARLHTGASIVRGRSRCDACGEDLGPFDLIPVISWAIAGGRARCCSARISASSTLGEILLGALFALSYLQLGLSLPLAILLAALVLLYALVRYDLAHQILPPPLLYAFVLLAFCYAWLVASSLAGFYLALIIAASLGAFLLLIYLFSRGKAMGFADAPLVFALALFTAPRALAGFAFSFWIGAGIGIILVTRFKHVRMKSEVPLAPFMAAGFLLAYFIPWDPFAPLIALLH